jgi:hypothetical protein
MAHGRTGKLSLADRLVAQVGVNGSERLAGAVDCSCFEALLGGVYARVGDRATRRWSCSSAFCCSNGIGSAIRRLRRPLPTV